MEVNFLNIYITHRARILFTRVYHDPKKQSFLLPYVVGHPRLLYRQWLQFALIRAALCSSHIDDFYDEQRYIELTFLANGYSLDFVEYHIRQFYRFISPQNPNIELDRYKFNGIRTFLFTFLKQQKYNLEQQQQLAINHKYIQLPYLYDWGLRWKFNREFYIYWTDIIESDPKFKTYGLKIKLNSKHCYSSNALLALNNEIIY